jgi:hypothetical protein
MAEDENCTYGPTLLGSFSKQKYNRSILEEEMEESLGLGKKSYGTENDTKT